MQTKITKFAPLICMFLYFMVIDVIAETNQSLLEETPAIANDSDIGAMSIIINYLLLDDDEPVEPPSYSPLNDTGITWGGDSPDGNNTTCISNFKAPQDCHQGRDATHNDDSDGHAGFSYTKISSTGAALPASATSWSCVWDNVTGLTWEVKTRRAMFNTYRWGGKTHLGTWYGTYYDDWDGLVERSNSESLCGASDWRVPTIKELENLVNQDHLNPAIDTAYFPNTAAERFWSASPGAYFPDTAWFVHFGDGYSSNFRDRGYAGNVRLVRGGE